MIEATPCYICGKPTDYIVGPDDPQPSHPACRDGVLDEQTRWTAGTGAEPTLVEVPTGYCVTSVLDVLRRDELIKSLTTKLAKSEQQRDDLITGVAGLMDEVSVLPKVYKLKYVPAVDEDEDDEDDDERYEFAAIFDVHRTLVEEGRGVAERQTEENPVYFIDLMPDANWAHPCLYVRMRERSRGASVVQHNWPPHADNIDGEKDW